MQFNNVSFEDLSKLGKIWPWASDFFQIMVHMSAGRQCQRIVHLRDFTHPNHRAYEFSFVSYDVSSLSVAFFSQAIQAHD